MLHSVVCPASGDKDGGGGDSGTRQGGDDTEQDGVHGVVQQGDEVSELGSVEADGRPYGREREAHQRILGGRGGARAQGYARGLQEERMVARTHVSCG